MCDYVVIGGGISGISCIDELLTLTSHNTHGNSHITSSESRITPDNNQITSHIPPHNNHTTSNNNHASSSNHHRITLITCDETLKMVKDCQSIGECMERITIDTMNYQQWSCKSNVNIIVGRVTRIDTDRRLVYIADDGPVISYTKLTLACGARPHFITPPHNRVIGVRDSDSVERLASVLECARRIVIVGNGGIGLEMAYALRRFNVVWAIKDDHVGDVFLDREASAFLLPRLFPQSDPDVAVHAEKRQRVEPPSQQHDSSVFVTRNSTTTTGEYHGASLGPSWLSLLTSDERVDSSFHDRHHEGHVSQTDMRLQLRFSCTIDNVVHNDRAAPNEWPMHVTLVDNVKKSGSEVIGCDFLVCATGVEPNTDFLPPSLERGPTNGVKINELMETSCEDVYAAGDVADAVFAADACSSNWFQMRLWSQAKMMGVYCARRMTDNYDELGFFFELFTHVTQFFGVKVVLLGRYNAQGVPPDDVHIIMRCTPGKEYIKLVLVRWRLVGAVLLGETDMEETFENLILNQMDLSQFGDDLLNEQVDLADFFD